MAHRSVDEDQLDKIQAAVFQAYMHLTTGENNRDEVTQNLWLANEALALILSDGRD